MTDHLGKVNAKVSELIMRLRPRQGALNARVRVTRPIDRFSVKNKVIYRIHEF